MAMSLGAAEFALSVDQAGFNAGLKQAEGAARSASSSISGALGGVSDVLGKLGSVAFTGIAAGAVGLAGGLGIAAKSAADFQSQISGIAAVGGADAVARMSEISAKALQVGKDTTFSASQAATGMQELIKAGVSISDVLGGATDATVALAAATGVDLASAAGIASTAMNTFSLSGADVGKVADIVAGAANASAIDVTDFKFSLAAAGAVAATVGLGFKDTAVAIAELGQAGLKGSDAGTSLKTFLLGLTPSSKSATTAMKELGLITAAGANQFFDATGKVKSMAEIQGVLQKATAGLTEQQKLSTLQTIFGTDAIRAAAVLSKDGAAGFTEMAAAMDKVSAADVAKTRLDNLNGSIEALKGSLETASITIGTALLPGLKMLTDSAVGALNNALPSIESFAAQLPAIFAGIGAAIGPPVATAFGLLKDSVVTVLQVFQNDWSNGLDAAGNAIDPFTAMVGNTALVLRDQVIPALQTFAAIAGSAFEQAFSFILANGPAIQGALIGIGAVLAVLAAGAGIAAVGAALAALVTPIGLLVAGAALLGAAWSTNFGDIQGKTAAAWAVIQPILIGIGDAISTAWAAAQPALAALGDALGQLGSAFDTGGLSGVLDLLSSTLADGLNALGAIAMTALAPVGEAIGAFFSGLGTGVQTALAAAGEFFAAGWATLSSTALGLVEALHQGITNIWNLIPGDIQADLILIGTTLATRFAEFVTQATTWMSSMAAALQAGWGILSTATAAGWAFITTTIGTALTGILTAVGTWVSGVVAKITELGDLALTGAGIIGDNILKPITTKIAEVLGAITTWGGDVVTRLAGVAGTALAEGAKIGQAIVDGIGNALNAGLTFIGNAAADLAREAIRAAKAALGIESPSTEFYAVGEQSIAGFVNALSDGNSVVANAIRAVVQNALKNGVDPLIALALAKAESSLNPNAIGDQGHSVGLFQLHDRGQGAGLSVAQRQDPNLNASTFLGQHGDLFKKLQGQGLQGPDLATVFGRQAEGSDPQFASRYGQAYKELLAIVGSGAPVFQQATAGVTQLNATVAQGPTLAERLATAQTVLTQTLSQQAPPLRLTTDAMKDFGANLLPIENQVANGAISLDTLQFKLIDLARATGLATTPWEKFSAGTISADQAMEQVINSAADAGPQFDALRKYFDSAGSSSRDAALRFLQLALNYQQGGGQIQTTSGVITAATASTITAAQALAAVTPAIGTTETAIAAAGSETVGTAGDVAGMTAKFTALRPTIDAARQALSGYTDALGQITTDSLDKQASGWDKIRQAIDDALKALKDYLDALSSAPSGATPPGFATGGIVPGIGPQLTILHGGEMVSTVANTRRMLSQPALLSGYSGGSTHAGSDYTTHTQDWSGADDTGSPVSIPVILDGQKVAELIDPRLRAIRNKDMTLRRR